VENEIGIGIKNIINNATGEFAYYELTLK